jgi:hypothetical protein
VTHEGVGEALRRRDGEPLVPAKDAAAAEAADPVADGRRSIMPTTGTSS